MGRRRVLFWVAGAAVLVAAVTLIVWESRSRQDPVVLANVQITLAGFWLSADERGTDVSGTIDNLNNEPVDVTVRVRGFDIAGHMVVEKTLGPFRRVAPRQPFPVSTYFDCTPLETVTLEGIRIERSDEGKLKGREGLVPARNLVPVP